MDIRIIKPEVNLSTRLVKSEDLNHHGSLFAGRTAEWFVESAFVAATSKLDPKSVVCLNMHGMYFKKPARSGDVLKFSSKIVYTGRTSITVYVNVVKRGDVSSLVDGFVTFVHVNPETSPSPHYLSLEPVTEEEKELYETARALRSR